MPMQHGSRPTTSFVNHLCSRFYTTPKSYLDLIALYISLLRDKRTEYAETRERLLNGLSKLRDTNVVVEKMQAELTRLTPVLEEKTKAGLANAVVDRSCVMAAVRGE